MKQQLRVITEISVLGMAAFLLPLLGSYLSLAILRFFALWNIQANIPHGLLSLCT